MCLYSTAHPRLLQSLLPLFPALPVWALYIPTERIGFQHNFECLATITYTAYKSYDFLGLYNTTIWQLQ